MKEFFFIAMCLRERLFSLKNDLTVCNMLGLNSTACEDSLATIESVLNKINNMFNE